jgi:hypothetical protein
VTKTNLSALDHLIVALSDVNRDSHLDVTATDANGNIQVLFGTGSGTFLLKPVFFVNFGPSPPNVMAMADFNGDGKPDLALGFGTNFPLFFVGQACLVAGYGDGTFKLQTTYPAKVAMTGIVQASVRQDGIASLLGIDSASKRFVLLPGVGDGTFGAALAFPFDRVPTAIVAGDFNHDDAPDIVLLGLNTVALSNGGFVVFYNQGGDQVAVASSSTKANRKPVGHLHRPCDSELRCSWYAYGQHHLQRWNTYFRHCISECGDSQLHHTIRGRHTQYIGSVRREQQLQPQPVVHTQYRGRAVGLSAIDVRREEHSPPRRFELELHLGVNEPAKSSCVITLIDAYTHQQRARSTQTPFMILELQACSGNLEVISE